MDLATGAERAAIPLSRFPSGADVAADGRIVAAGRDGLVTVRPGEAARSLRDTKGLESPRFAGDAIVAVDDGRPVVLLPDGSRQSFEPPTRIFTSLATDVSGSHVARERLCPLRPVLVGLTAGGRPVPVDGDRPLHDRRRAAARPPHPRPGDLRHRADRHCRGTVLGKFGGRVVARGRFAVRAGQQRWVRMRVTRAAVKRFRRAGWGSMIIDARVPDGRVGAGADGSELSVKVRRAG